MIASFDYYNRFEQPIISLRSPNDKFIGFVDNIKNLKISPEFNAVSEMTCDIYKYGDDVELKIYDDIKVKRQLFIEDVGFFIITEVSENDSEDGVYKSLTLYSCEHELSYKKLTYFNGTYQFWDSMNPSESLMGIILNSLPRWSIGHVDGSIATLHRTFEEPDTTIYAFLMDDVEDSYGCLFNFDIINRVINVYDKNNYINKTTILLSRKDVIDNLKVDTKSEEIYTALTLYGDDEITYSGINPLGTSTVYNFNYYKEWMSDGLKTALETWETNIVNAETSISTLRTNLSNKYTERQTIQGEIDSINQQITLLEKQLGVNTLDTTMVSSLTAQINTKKTELSEKETAFDNKTNEINTINQQLDEIYASCRFENNFTEEQMQELDAYIFESSDVDDTFTFTDDMSYEEQEQILVGLYNKAKSMLSDISVPTEELSLDTNNFIFQKEFFPYTEQLNTGVIVDVEIKDDVIVSYVLLKMEVNYHDKTINLTFGNKYRSSAAEKLWSNWESEVSKSSTTLTYERSKYGKAVDSGSLDKMNSFMKSSLNLTLNQIKTSDGQSFEVTDSGTKFRRINPDTGEIDPEQMWHTANGIVFTNDNWQTIKTAIGRLILPNGEIGYGINTEYLLGKLLISENLEINNQNNNLTINEDGFQISNTISKIILNPNAENGNIFQVLKNEEAQLYIDQNGNIKINGAIIDLSGAYVPSTDESGVPKNYEFKEYIEAKTISVANLDANVANLINATIENATIKSLNGKYANIQYIDSNFVKTTELVAEIAKLGYLTADEADLKYANITFGNIDTANIDVANIGLLFAKVGLIDRATIIDGHITGYLDAVEINANSITAGTLIADRILLKGSESGLLYALNNLGELTSTEVDTLDGTILTQRTVTADKLVANSITANELDVTNIFGNSAVLSTLVSQEAFINAISTNKVVVGAYNKSQSIIDNIYSPGTTTIDGSKITTGSITANKLFVKELTSLSSNIAGFQIKGGNPIYPLLATIKSGSFIQNADGSWTLKGSIGFPQVPYIGDTVVFTFLYQALEEVVNLEITISGSYNGVNLNDKVISLQLLSPTGGDYSVLKKDCGVLQLTDSSGALKTPSLVTITIASDKLLNIEEMHVSGLVSDGRITYNTDSFATDDDSLYISNKGISLGKTFSVTSKGYFETSSGKIADYTIDSEKLSYVDSTTRQGQLVGLYKAFSRISTYNYSKLYLGAGVYDYFYFPCIEQGYIDCNGDTPIEHITFSTNMFGCHADRFSASSVDSDLVPRISSSVPTPSGYNEYTYGLGSPSQPWNDLYVHHIKVSKYTDGDSGNIYAEGDVIAGVGTSNQVSLQTLNSNLTNLSQLCTFVGGYGTDIAVTHSGWLIAIDVPQGNWLLVGYNGSTNTCWLNGIVDQNDSGYLAISAYSSFAKSVGLSGNKTFFLQNLSGGTVQNKASTYLFAIRLNN